MPIFTGTNLKDTLFGGSGNDSMSGLDGDDYLQGNQGDDTIYGGSGNDSITGDEGNDLMFGGDGDDEIDYVGNHGNDTVRGGAGNDLISFFSSSGNKIIYADEGNDTVTGAAGNDSIDGGEGNDKLYGNDGNDTISGGIGNDYIKGEGGVNILDGGLGDDSVYGGGGNDTLLGGGGNDLLSNYQKTGNVIFNGGEGDDTIWGGQGNDDIVGGLGDDERLEGYEGNDTINGGAGDDKLYGDQGNDSLSGGEGDDKIYGGDGSDTIEGGLGDDSDLDGGTGSDSISGGNGEDVLWGLEGNDTLDGGLGNDSLYGGAGNDTYYVDSVFDHISDFEGTDSAYVSASFVKLPSTIENLYYTNGAQALPYWISALLPDSASGNKFATLLGNPKLFGYFFPTSLPTYDISADHAKGFTAFSANQRATALTALTYISSVIDVSFTEKSSASSANTLSFASNSQVNSSGYARFPSSSFSGSDIFINNSSDYASLANGTFGAYTLMHEIGHALGLKHPFDEKDADGNVEEPPYLQGAEDSTQWTYLSYNESSSEYYIRYSPLDIAALQYLYGPSKTARAGNDRYSISASTANFIWDGAGQDSIDASGANQSATVYLSPGYWGYLGASKASTISSPGQITVNFGSTIENLVGSPFADKLYGSDVANTIEGGAGNDLLEGWEGDDTLKGGVGDDTLLGGIGNDSLDGAEGSDTLRLSGTFLNYKITFNVEQNKYYVQAKAGDEGNDVFENFEFIAFSDKTVQLSTLDLTAPTVKLFSNKYSLASGQVAVITFQLSEPSNFFDLSDVQVSGGTLSSFFGSGQTYTATFTPSSDSVSVGFVSVSSGKFTDAAGNDNEDGLEADNTLTIKLNEVLGTKYIGSGSDETILGTLGQDTINGAGGVDTFVVRGKISDYIISYNRAAGKLTLTDKRTSNADSVLSVEKLKFDDKTFDLNNQPFSSTPTYGKTASFLFDSAYYLLKNPELVPAVSIANAFEHYLSAGAASGKTPNTWFDPVYYANKWADLKPLNLDAATLFMHYNLYGVWEGRSAGPTFDRYDGNRYLRDNPDVAAYVDANVKDFLGSRVNGAIAHYIIYGANESRVGYDTTGQAIDPVILVGSPALT